MTEFYVLDQNVMQRPELHSFVENHPKAKYVIPETALVEMCKSNQWEITFQKNFRPLIGLVNRCYLSASIQETLDYEIQYKRAIHDRCQPRLLPRPYSKHLRELIAGSQSQNVSRAYAVARRNFERSRNELLIHDLNPQTTREQMEKRVNDIIKNLPPEQLKLCRKQDTARMVRLIIGRNVGNSLFESLMRSRFVPSQIAQRLKKSKCMTLRWAYLTAHHALQWAGDGGIESTKDKVLLNDVLDQDYVLVASFFTGIVSNENAVRMALEDLHTMLKLPDDPAVFRESLESQ